ncbi:MAG: carboxypeptidase regulatory-like domain-containing protein, partial [Acidobacteria bacterium]|nr:carboxypeptidase regulatory-like domain-containing protein [Acidobacteriota bacterium]
MSRLQSALFIFALVFAALAQDPRGRILGRVSDSSGGVIPGVSVSARNLETGVSVTAQSNDQGNYLLLHLNPGRYRIFAELTGFKKFERREVEVRVGDAITIEIGLEPGALSESVTVTAETPLLEASEATVGQLVDRRRLIDLPLAGGNPLYLLQLTPGIISTNASSHGWFPHALDSISNVAAVGTRTRSNQFALDGNPIMTQGGQVSYSPPPEMVQEMKVQTAPFDASLGGFSGANFNIVTRSGANTFHGDLWFSHYSRPLTTRNFFVNRFIFDPTTGPITEEKKKANWPPVLTNRYRATVSGPVIENKTFFVYGYDRLFRKRPVTGTNTVPMAEQRNGDFSQLLKLGSRYQIYDPATIQTAAGGRFSRLPLAGNLVP